MIDSTSKKIAATLGSTGPPSFFMHPSDFAMVTSADLFLALSYSGETEACPLLLAPTSSTTATLAMGDAIAVTLMKVRDFQPENFARFHPGACNGD
jgi:arabinose-5-phosphate isomerase